jgi:hypothetical protein
MTKDKAAYPEIKKFPVDVIGNETGHKYGVGLSHDDAWELALMISCETVRIVPAPSGPGDSNG